jgi:RHS repeat-associated protein
VYFFNGEKRFEKVLADLPGPYEPLRLSVQYFGGSDGLGVFGSRWFLNWEKSAVVQGGAPIIRFLGYYPCMYGDCPNYTVDGFTSYQVTITEPGNRSVTYTGPCTDIFYDWSPCDNGHCYTSYNNSYINRYLGYNFGIGKNAATLYSTDGWNSSLTVSADRSTIVRNLSCGTREEYARTGTGNYRLNSYYDKAGNRVQFQYNGPGGRLSGIVDALGRSVTITYPTGSAQVSSISDWTGRMWSFQANTNLQQLTAIQYPPTADFPAGHQERFDYQNSSDVNLVTGVGWNSDPAYMNIAYDARRRVTSESFVLGNSSTFSYDNSSGNQTTVVNSDGSGETYHYDTTARLIEHRQIRQASSTCPENGWQTVTNTTYFTPNAAGQVTNSISSVGLAVTASYTGWGGLLNRTETDTATGQFKNWAYTYDTSGCGRSAGTIQDPAGNVTSIIYEFDQGGTRSLPVQIVQPAVINALTGNLEQPTWSLQYDNLGRVTTLQDPSGQTMTFVYSSGLSHPVSITTSGGGSNLTFQLAYDALDRLTGIITPTGWTNTLVYDARDQLVTNYSNLSTSPTNSLAYDAWGNITAIQSSPGSAGGAGGELQAVYDALGALTAVTNQLRSATTVQHNGQRKVQSITRALGRENDFEYRSDGMLKKALDALSNPTDFCYDQFGRVSQVRDANGHSYQFEYDAWNRLTKQTFADTTFEIYGYDGLDRLTNWVNRAGQTTSYGYDALGRLVQENRPEGTWTYRYLLTGELKETRFNGNVTSSYTYDGLGRLVSQTEYGRTIGYSYDNLGRRTAVTYPDNWQIGEMRDTASRLMGITALGATDYSRLYDGMGRVSVEYWFGSAVVKSNYYDAAGQLTNWTVSATTGWTQTRNLGYDAGGRIVTQKINSAVRQYSYDLTDQLTNSTGASSYSAGYDAVGNRQTADRRGYTVNNLNAYTQLTASAQTLTYDANGNISGWGGTSFSHDSQGQLTNLTAGSQSTACQYDWRRLRVNGGTAAYSYDAMGNLRQIADGGNTTQYVYVDGIDHAVLLRRNGQLYALITDHLGSVVAILNSTGNLVETYDYTPFGKTTIRNSSGTVVSSSGVGNVLGFTGRECDVDSGQYYCRHRWYSPDLGRFLEPDPIGLAGWDVNLYRYVGNGPIGEKDPLGLWSWGSLLPPVGSFGRYYLTWVAEEIGIGLAYGYLLHVRLSEIEALLRARGIPGERYWFPILPVGIGAFVVECDPCTGICTRRFILTGYGSPGFIPPGTPLPGDPWIA